MRPRSIYNKIDVQISQFTTQKNVQSRPVELSSSSHVYSSGRPQISEKHGSDRVRLLTHLNLKARDSDEKHSNKTRDEGWQMAEKRL